MSVTPDNLEVVESRAAILDLTAAEAETLLMIGRELASSSSWWGGSNDQHVRSVISAELIRVGRYKVLFRDVIGVVKVGAKQIAVKPKIPLDHFTYIASWSDMAPRLSSTATQISQGTEFTGILARWCVDAAEKLLRHGLRKDYTDITDSCEQVRGRVHPLETAMLTCAGVPQAVCSYQDFSDDTMLNRVVKAACQRLSRLGEVDDVTRSRARQVAFRMNDVGELRFDDLKVRVDRLSVSYARVLPLARLVLSGLGITVTVGRNVGTAFLVRTPELIEDGLRSILKDQLFNIEVSKRRLMLGDSGLSINPDLVFGESLAVGDVKYRALTKDWSKPDLNQVITFATGFRAQWAAIIGFSIDSLDLPRRIDVGDVSATAFSWVTCNGLAPAASAAKLCASVSSWLELVADAQRNREFATLSAVGAKYSL